MPHDTPTSGESPKTNLPNGVLIVGAAKSGTTGLFYAMKHALSAGQGVSVTGLWEPRRSVQVEDYWRSTTDQVRLVKMLLLQLFRHRDSFVHQFDKRILIYRDPRDNVISRLHFILKNLVDARDKQKVGALVELFREKERDPTCISVVGMLSTIERITERDGLLEVVRRNALLPAKLMREHGNAFYAMRYDDLVACRFERLSDYLGFRVATDFEVPAKHAHVIRSKSSGAWKDWFLDEDIQFFVRDVSADFDILGFDAEAKSNLNKHIDPRTSGDYVGSLFNRMQVKRKRPRRLKRRGENSRLNLQ